MVDSIQAVLDWAVETLLRPVLILLCGMLLFNLPTVLYKIRMLVTTVLYFVLCHDKSWKKQPDPGSIFGPHLSAGGKVDRKTVYFVRHGESTWNDTFNKGSHRSALVFVLGFIPGLIKAVLFELYLLLSGKLDSWFYDAPLSHLGLEQVQELHRFLQTKEGPEQDAVKILRADPGAPSSKLICSNLRRAVSTLAGGFADRLKRRPDEKILIFDPLQEISRNPDTLSITPAFCPFQASWIEKQSALCEFSNILSNQTDVSMHSGNKPLKTNGMKRMLEFCDFVQTIPEDHVIVGGHSIWFRSFFRSFLPYSVTHVSKQRKIVNGGIVSFDLLKAETKRGVFYMVDPKTIRVVYGGF